MTKTTTVKKANVDPKWHHIDVKGKVLGRVASDIAALLIGKNKATFSTHINVGDKVVVTNAAKISVTGNKMKQKMYHRPTGYPGSVKSLSLEDLMAKKPTEAVRLAVKGMLPKNKLSKPRMSNLYVYEGTEHPHTPQFNKEE